MSKVKKRNKRDKGVRKKRKKWLIPVICLILIGLAVCVFYGLRDRSPTKTPTTISQKKETPDFERLVGSWVRPDGGYVIEVRKIHPDGKVDAAYFNPRPINVSKSSVSEEGGVMTLFIELQGQGYPGSTYKLQYNREYDALVGVYFQAAIKKPFEVVFKRK